MYGVTYQPNFSFQNRDEETLLLTRNYPTNYNTDAWGRPKATLDISVLHGMFTFDIPNKAWVLVENGTELPDASTSTRSGSVNRKLSLKSGGTLNDVSLLRTKRHPRYQPNRGHLYSVSIFLPIPTASGERDFGIFTNSDGAFFRLKPDENIYACILSGGVLKKEELIAIPFDIDFSKGNIYDIQFQWRGVGNYKYYIGNPNTGLPELVHEIKFLGTTDALSIENPAMPIGYKATNNGDEVEIISGCADVTTEGGGVEREYFVSIPSNEITVSTFSDGDTASSNTILAVRIPETFSGAINTRDCRLARIKVQADKKSNTFIYETRDITALTVNVGSWVPVNGGNIEAFKPVSATDLTFDSTKATFVDKAPIEANAQNFIDSPDPDRIDFFLTRGDYLIIVGSGASVTMQAIAQLGEEL